jgi:hypothetical protein
MGSRERQARNADNLTANCEAIVYTTWDPHRLTTLTGIALLYFFTYLIFIVEKPQIIRSVGS